ncbi:MAG: glycosyltransferase family 9 protein [Gemmatimonadetes bacterium]|nr:glycosyltransferase family 9 protein [Gemmatimonadota bacterium]
MSRVPMDRVCLVMMSAVGDVVHVLPLLTALKRANPAMHVTWVLQPGPAGLVRGHPLVDEILLFDRTKGLGGFLEIRRALHARRFDLVINLQVYFKAGIITSFTRAPVKLGFDRARARDANWLFTTHRIAPHAMQHVSGFDRPIAPIVVATSKPVKDWLPERWAEVCDALWHDFGLQPVLVGARSPRELHAERVILERAKHLPVSALGQGGLRGLVGILDAAALVLSPDTGPLHITVALDRPVVSLIAYSNPKRVGPYRTFGDLMVDAYGDPGEDYPISMENRPDRMPRITVQQVLDRVERWRTHYAADYPPRLTPAPKS